MLTRLAEKVRNQVVRNAAVIEVALYQLVKRELLNSENLSPRSHLGCKLIFPRALLAGTNALRPLAYRRPIYRRTLRVVEVLIDQDAVRRGSSPNEPWKLYDLGHGYCSYDFFDQCPHRMACARCDFYVPKESSKAQSIEAKANLLRLRQDIPLNKDELRAVEDWIAGHEKLVAKLVSCPTPATIDCSEKATD